MPCLFYGGLATPLQSGVRRTCLIRVDGPQSETHSPRRGGGYHLLDPAEFALQGNGCCCTFLPSVLRNYP